MILQPAHSNPAAIIRGGNPGWIYMLPFWGDATQHAQVAALGLASYTDQEIPRIKLWFLQTMSIKNAEDARAGQESSFFVFKTRP